MRSLRIEFPGALYHITSRGNAKQFIYLDEIDKKNFLKIFTSVVERFNWLCHSYCLMNNHYHLIIETPEGNLSRGMRQLNGVYTQNFNLRHNRVGHLFQGRYKAILVEKETYLLVLSRYVVLNPLRAGLVKMIEDWEWSSHRAITGIGEKPPFLTVDWILSQFGDDKSIAKSRYKQFVLDGITEDFPKKDLHGQILLGTKRFIDKFDNTLRAKGKLKEVPRVQRYATRPSLRDLFPQERLREKKFREEAIYTAYVLYGYTLSEIAAWLGVHYVTISRTLKKAEERKRKMS